MAARTLAEVVAARSEIQAAIVAVSRAAEAAEDLEMAGEASVLAGALHPLIQARKLADDRIARARAAGATEEDEV